MANIGAFCASTNGHQPPYKEAAEKTGELIGIGKHTLIYGGCDLGLMGVVFNSAKNHGAKTIGMKAEELMTTNPQRLLGDRLVVDAVNLMEKLNRTSVFVIEPDTGRLAGLVRMYDLLLAKVL